MVGYAIHSKRPLHIYYADAKVHLPMTSVMVAKWSPNARQMLARMKGKRSIPLCTNVTCHLFSSAPDIISTTEAEWKLNGSIMKVQCTTNDKKNCIYQNFCVPLQPIWGASNEPVTLCDQL